MMPAPPAPRAGSCASSAEPFSGKSPDGFSIGPIMDWQMSLSLAPQGERAMERRFLVLFLPRWPTDYLKRRDPTLGGPLALSETVKGGLRLGAVDEEAASHGLWPGQGLADARALLPGLVVRALDGPGLAAAFADLADWHTNLSPLVAVMGPPGSYGDLAIDITGAAHLFGGESALLTLALDRLRSRGYGVAGAIAPTIGAAWALSHFARSQIVDGTALAERLAGLPVAALRLAPDQIAGLTQMGLRRIGQLHGRARPALEARFGSSLLLRLDQAYGHAEERLVPRLPLAEYRAERRFPDPIGLMDDVLAATGDLAIQLAHRLEKQGLGAQQFALLLYRVDHKVMTLAVRAARLTRDPVHVTRLFTHRAERFSGEYDAGFGIDMIRLEAGATGPLDPVQTGAFATADGLADLDDLIDRLDSRLGAGAVLRSQQRASHIPERAMRLVPAQSPAPRAQPHPRRPERPLRLLSRPEPIAITAEVPDGLPAAMLWRHNSYRLLRAAGPERLEAEWWRRGQRLELVPQPDPQTLKPAEQPPYVAALPRFDARAQTRDYYAVEDETGCRFWIFRQGFYGEPVAPTWYLHGFFA